ncbi:MAG: hypothetical protein A2W93_14050 [Bacteroidetes bacterium GWF2_43_63]|nr:MAG: hypothetical protein A2W94_00620 [Bacteroidetes bacterium GWE2_42_42]OFY52466.1 MAG: hypothetical protein A2W93_14050 [Bacteroidetes bacterium GWF2_43_63]HBG71373.1 hypothetical protein [Bacteroidales bacterium]HCB60876.1 hypothetical protein [Bacteroidales bacterium]HCY23949.1 hypothetical protein [Bacteroidales bacterium]
MSCESGTQDDSEGVPFNFGLRCTHCWWSQDDSGVAKMSGKFLTVTIQRREIASRETACHVSRDDSVTMHSGWIDGQNNGKSGEGGIGDKQLHWARVS